MTDNTNIDAVPNLPQQAIDAGWRFASGINADDLKRPDANVVKDFELAFENTESGLLVVGRGQSYDQAYRDAMNQIGIEPA